MILALDAGNTNICAGCIEGGEVRLTARIATDRRKTEDEYAGVLEAVLRMNGVGPDSLDGSIICSVVPPVNRCLSLAVEMITGRTPLFVKPGLKTGLALRVDNPEGLGSDRIADAVAASALYGGTVIVVDMGTMTTLSVVNGKKEFLGGAICPGIRLSQQALAAGTSQLPAIGLDPPERAIGRNTVECMKSGAIFGTAAMVDGLIAGIRRELAEKGEPAPRVVMTGGISRFIAPYCREAVTVDPDLLLKGLWLLYQKNVRRKEAGEMILAADISNAHITLGCIGSRGVYFTSRFATLVQKTEDEYAVDFYRVLELNGVSAAGIEGAVISSVVPPADFAVTRALEKVTGHRPLVVGPGVKTGLNIRIDDPAQLGANLVAGAVAALDRYTPPMVIFDMGAATTASVINRQGQYTGGFISPGVRIALDAGASGTAQLPRVALERPETVIGRSTVSALQSGAVYGTAGMLDGMVSRIAGEMGEPEEELTVIATGGAAEEAITALCHHPVIFDRQLTLHGLWLIWKKNTRPGPGKS